MVEKRVPFFRLFISGAMIMFKVESNFYFDPPFQHAYEYMEDVVEHAICDSYEADLHINEGRRAYDIEKYLVRKLPVIVVKRVRQRRWKSAWAESKQWVKMQRNLYRFRRLLPKAVRELNGWYMKNEADC